MMIVGVVTAGIDIYHQEVVYVVFVEGGIVGGDDCWMTCLWYGEVPRLVGILGIA